jgi:hypothetical protein
MSEALEAEPRWIAEAARAGWHEALLYARTFAGATLRPGRFVRGWLAGERAMNPFGFLATSAALLATSTSLLGHLLDRDEGGSSLLEELQQSLSPYVYYAALGLIVHGVLVATGSRRKLSSSIAVALYAGGGPATLMTLLYVALAAVLRPKVHVGLVLAAPPAWQPLVKVVIVGAFLAFPVAFALGVRALHRASLVRTLLALALAISLLGLVLGRLQVGVGTAHLRLFPRGGHAVDVYF